MPIMPIVLPIKPCRARADRLRMRGSMRQRSLGIVGAAGLHRGRPGDGPAPIRGAPDIGNGKAIAKTYLHTLKGMEKKVPALKTMAESLPTSSKDALQTAGKAIGQALDDVKRGGEAHVAFLDPDHVVSQGLSACGGIFPL